MSQFNSNAHGDSNELSRRLSITRGIAQAQTLSDLVQTKGPTDPNSQEVYESCQRELSMLEAAAGTALEADDMQEFQKIANATEIINDAMKLFADTGAPDAERKDSWKGHAVSVGTTPPSTKKKHKTKSKKKTKRVDSGKSHQKSGSDSEPPLTERKSKSGEPKKKKSTKPRRRSVASAGSLSDMGEIGFGDEPFGSTTLQGFDDAAFGFDATPPPIFDSGDTPPQKPMDEWGGPVSSRGQAAVGSIGGGGSLIRIFVDRCLFLPPTASSNFQIEAALHNMDVTSQLPAPETVGSVRATGPRSSSSSGECIWREELALPLPLIPLIALRQYLSDKALVLNLWDPLHRETGGLPLARAHIALTVLLKGDGAAPPYLLLQSPLLGSSSRLVVKPILELRELEPPPRMPASAGRPEKGGPSSAAERRRGSDVRRLEQENSALKQTVLIKSQAETDMEIHASVLNETIEQLKSQLTTAKNYNLQLSGYLQNANRKISELEPLIDKLEASKRAIEEKEKEIQTSEAETAEARKETEEEREEVRRLERRLREKDEIGSDLRQRLLREKQKTNVMVNDLEEAHKATLGAQAKTMDAQTRERHAEARMQSLEHIVRSNAPPEDSLAHLYSTGGVGKLMARRAQQQDAIQSSYRAPPPPASAREDPMIYPSEFFVSVPQESIRSTEDDEFSIAAKDRMKPFSSVGGEGGNVFSSGGLPLEIYGRHVVAKRSDTGGVGIDHEELIPALTSGYRFGTGGADRGQIERMWTVAPRVDLGMQWPKQPMARPRDELRALASNFQECILSRRGVLFDDGVCSLEWDSRIIISRRLAEFSITATARPPTSVHEFELQLEKSVTGGLALSLNSPPDFAGSLTPGETVAYRGKCIATSAFCYAPLIQMHYRHLDDSHLIMRLRLPLVASSFIAPLKLSTREFAKLWTHPEFQKAERLAVCVLAADVMASGLHSIERSLELGGALYVIGGGDPNPDNFLAAGYWDCGPKTEGAQQVATEKRSYPVLTRVMIGRGVEREGLALIAVRSYSVVLASGVKDDLVAILGRVNPRDPLLEYALSG